MLATFPSAWNYGKQKKGAKAGGDHGNEIERKERRSFQPRMIFSPPTEEQAWGWSLNERVRCALVEIDRHDNHAFSTVLFRVFLTSKETEYVQRGRATCFPPFGRGAYVYNCARVHSSCFNQEIDLRKVLERFRGHLRIVWIHSWLHFRFCFYTKPIFTVDDRERKRCQSETKLSSNIRTRTTCIIVSMSLCNDACRVFCVFRVRSRYFTSLPLTTPLANGLPSLSLFSSYATTWLDWFPQKLDDRLLRAPVLLYS